ncbi:MAG: dTDP-4-dehydrorhamnose reductase [Candidatus Acidiferrum sp.]
MKARILLTGKDGQIGSALLRLLPKIGEVFAPGRHELDLADTENIRRVVRTIRPQLIVNAAAYTKVDAAESDEANARAVNADAPARLAEEAKKIGAAIVQYSTDYVFDGLKGAPYEETDATNPISIYGKTKLAGELAVRESGAPYLILRTAWVYATHGRNFLLTMLRLATEKEELRIVRDQIGAPTWSPEIAAATTEILAQVLERSSASSAFPLLSGIYHLTAAGETTWCDFARAILEEASHTPESVPWFAAATDGRPLHTRRIIPISTQEFPTAAARPAYSVLSNSLLIQTFGIQMQNWRTQLRRAFAFGGTRQQELPTLARIAP